MPIRVLIVDDHPIVRQGLRTFLGLDPDFNVVGEGGDGAEGVRLARELKPDVVLMDLLMPVMDGITATATIRRELPDTEVLALTSVVEDQLVVNAIQAGAIGYMLKDTDVTELRRAIKAAAGGQVTLSPAVAAKLMREIRAPASPEKLTAREEEVLTLVARGYSNKEISQSLSVSDTTVKSHVSNILGKLGLPSRTQAALYAIRVGMVTLDTSAQKTQ
jgi:two-component system, NarL family, response regulator LiaR